MAFKFLLPKYLTAAQPLLSLQIFAKILTFKLVEVKTESEVLLGAAYASIIGKVSPARPTD